MSSRQDQLHSYRFAVQRVVSALVMRDTDPDRPPFARMVGAALAGVLIAMIALGGVAVYDLVVGGGATNWRSERVVIVERETGARYVYRGDRLHPVVNYASALLIAGSADASTVLVSRRSMQDVPRGAPLGIAGAPDSLPAADRLAGLPWTLCSASATPVLLVGSGAAGGRPLADDGLLVTGAGETYLLWRDRRHPVPGAGVRAALGWGAARPVEVAPALLNNLPLGAALAPPPIPGLGEVSPALAGARIGQVYLVTTQGGSREYAVALRTGLAAITQVQADILLGDTRLAQPRPETLSQSAYAAAPRAGDLRQPGAPATTPPLATVTGPICGTAGADGPLTGLVADPTLPGAASYASAAVRVEPGRGALVESVAAPGAPGGTVSLVTALGQRHALASAEVLPTLGYAGAKPVRLAAGLVDLIPEGVPLDPVVAARPAR